MLIKKKILSAIVLLITLSGCGFTPVLSTEGDCRQDFKLQVKAYDQASAPGGVVFKFKSLLNRQIQSLNFNQPCKVNIYLTQSFSDMSYAPDATASRVQGKLTATVKIIDKDNQVFESKVNSITSFDKNAQDEFANQSAIDAAQERLIAQLSQVVFQVIAEFLYKGK